MFKYVCLSFMFTGRHSCLLDRTDIHISQQLLLRLTGDGILEALCKKREEAVGEWNQKRADELVENIMDRMDRQSLLPMNALDLQMEDTSNDL